MAKHFYGSETNYTRSEQISKVKLTSIDMWTNDIYTIPVIV